MVVTKEEEVSLMRKGAESVCRMLDGGLTLMDKIQHRHAQEAGTAEQFY